MGFWKNLFKNKLIENVEIVSHKAGLDKDDKLDNLIVGDLSGGFDGMVIAVCIMTIILQKQLLKLPMMMEVLSI